MKYSYPESIAKAAMWLDEVEPNWANKINIDTLRMDSIFTCVLGQIYEYESPDGYSYAIKKYFSNVRLSNKILNDNIFGTTANIHKWKEEIKSRRLKDGHDFIWAIKQLDANLQVSVRRKAWQPHSKIDSRCISNAHITMEDYLANDWELFKAKLYLSDLKPGEVFTAQDDSDNTKWTKLDNKGKTGKFWAMNSQTYEVIEISDNKEVTKCII